MMVDRGSVMEVFLTEQSHKQFNQIWRQSFSSGRRVQIILLRNKHSRVYFSNFQQTVPKVEVVIQEDYLKQFYIMLHTVTATCNHHLML